jgi:methionyl-tRNA synthetase
MLLPYSALLSATSAPSALVFRYSMRRHPAKLSLAMSQSPRKFFLTTPIYYVNARPHIGHAYTTIVADVLARRSRAQGTDTFFLTGTDEHGQKIERSAAAAGIPPQEFTDRVSETFREPWRRMGLTFDDFIRTTEPRHQRGVQKLFTTLEQNGHIYLDTYTGAYCVSDEAFVDVTPGDPCPDCGTKTDLLSESNFYFRLSAFQQPVLDLIESNELLIQPDTLRNEVLSFVRGGLKDLSISRTGITWGIPVPGHPDHVIYVWLDALANYMTAVGYGSDAPEDVAKFARYWPADLHLIGKEIARFHCVYWPAFLLAAKLPLPKKIAANGWLLFQDSKMSKSKGNVVRIETILDAFGPLCPPASLSGESVGLQPLEADPKREGASAPANPTKADQDLFASDVLRYFLLREIPFGQDGNFSLEALVTRYNADLANGYGNLVSRTLNMIHKYFDGIVPDPKPLEHTDFIISRVAYYTYIASFRTDVERQQDTRPFETDTIKALFASLDFAAAVQNITRLISHTDSFITMQAPWKAPANLDEQAILRWRSAVLYSAYEDIRIITLLLHPILPYATARVRQQLGLDPLSLTTYNSKLTTLEWGLLQPGTKLGPLSPIFPRADKGLVDLMNQLEQDKNTPIAHANAAHDTTPMPPSEFPETSLASESAASRAPEPAPASAPEPPGGRSPEITIDDFVKVELRVAQILVAERIPKADKLLRLEVDLGYEKRQILSGIAEWYSPEDLIGRRIVVITNLAPRKMRGLESHGMLLAASDGEHGKPSLATFLLTDDLPLGSRLK